MELGFLLLAEFLLTAERWTADMIFWLLLNLRYLMHVGAASGSSCEREHESGGGAVRRDGSSVCSWPTAAACASSMELQQVRAKNEPQRPAAAATATAAATAAEGQTPTTTVDNNNNTGGRHNAASSSSRPKENGAARHDESRCDHQVSGRSERVRQQDARVPVEVARTELRTNRRRRATLSETSDSERAMQTDDVLEPQRKHQHQHNSLSLQHMQQILQPGDSSASRRNIANQNPCLSPLGATNVASSLQQQHAKRPCFVKIPSAPRSEPAAEPKWTSVGSYNKRNQRHHHHHHHHQQTQHQEQRARQSKVPLSGRRSVSVDRVIVPATKKPGTKQRRQESSSPPASATERPLIQDFTYKPNSSSAYELTQQEASKLHADFPKPPARKWIQTLGQQQQQQQHAAQPNQQHIYANKVSKQQTEGSFYNRPDDLQSRDRFTVMSYNVLSDRMVNQERYPTSPELALHWPYRRELILNQLLEYGADIIALQELEWAQFDEHFEPTLRARGQYAGLFEPKSRFKTMDEKMRRRVDGCAIFYKTTKFDLIGRHLLEYSQMAMANARGSEAMLNRVMTKDQVALAAIFEIKRCAGQRLLVCNTHIHWDPGDCDVKLIQTIMLMNELGCLAQHYGVDHGAGPTTKSFNNKTTTTTNLFSGAQSRRHCLLLPLLLLGDFNSRPNSGVTNFLTDGNISSSHRDFNGFVYTSCSNVLARQQLAIGSSMFAGDQQQQQQQSECALEQRRQSSPAWWCYYAGGAPAAPPTSSPCGSTHSDSNSEAESSCDAVPPTYKYSHPFRLQSAYGETFGEKWMQTSFTNTFKAMIDYIFYSADSLQLLSFLGPLDRSWLRAHNIKGFPQPHIPSDHLPLMAAFRLKPVMRLKTLGASNSLDHRQSSGLKSSAAAAAAPGCSEQQQQHRSSLRRITIKRSYVNKSRRRQQ